MFLGVSDSPVMWACASISPGIRVLPATSMMEASETLIGSTDTAAIRLSFTSTLNEGWSSVKPSSKRFALVKSVSAITCPRLECLGQFGVALPADGFIVGPGDHRHLVHP